MQQVEEALSKIEKVVLASGISNDIIYFNYHKKRFRKMGETVSRIVPAGSKVLDIGSHYLHSSLLLSFMGYEVVSMDVSEFWELDYIRKRAADHQLTPLIENQLERLPTLSDQKDAFDLILFTEIFEHITFNPIAFWKKIFQIIKDSGHIYITTPNSINLYSITKTIINALRGKSIGMDVNAVFATVSYGHHWKEYSSSEVATYFAKMNDGFRLSIAKFVYKPIENSGSLGSYGRNLLIAISNKIPFFREAMEVIVQVDKSKPWKIDTPNY
jgi:2-polyprenyl-3-methyl-5-hydroxy-6-metoxy-1,4-benzoquinol methylase